jgi:hypothetical protein
MVMLTGMVNVAFWQPWSALVVMLIALVKVSVTVPLAGIVLPLLGVWLVKVMLLVLQLPTPPEAVMVPLPVTAVTLTG